jgi:hypothetical protein
VIKENQNKNMKINRNMTNLEQDLIMYGQVMQVVLNFRYFDALKNKQRISDEIISRIAAGVIDVFIGRIRQIFRSRTMSKAVKIKIYKRIVKPAVVFGSETWAVVETDMNRLGTEERKYCGTRTGGRARIMEKKN